MEFGFQIGNIKFLIFAQELTITGELDLFQRAITEEEADAKYTVFYDTGIRHINGEIVTKGRGYEVYSTEQEFIYSYNVGTTINPYKAFLYMEGSLNKIILPMEHRSELKKGYNISIMLGIEQVFLKNCHIMMHASVIKFQGKGILFSGPSGAGKSTQAELWKNHKGAEIINGDRAVLHVADRIVAYGSPYAGSSGIIKNEKTSVDAIILLKKSTENHIEKMSKRSSFGAIYQRFALLPWNQEMCNRGLDMIHIITQKVPIYSLYCTPDEHAVELVYRTVFNKG